MRVYLDNCAFNRPFDDQTQIRIRLESEAKLHVQTKMRQAEIELVWSYILEYENDQNPFSERKTAIEKWQSIAIVDVEETQQLLAQAKTLVQSGIRAKDALHVASAIEANADYFLTTDDKLLKKLKGLSVITAVNPIEMVKIIDEYDD